MISSLHRDSTMSWAGLLSFSVFILSDAAASDCASFSSSAIVAMLSTWADAGDGGGIVGLEFCSKRSRNEALSSKDDEGFVGTVGNATDLDDGIQFVVFLLRDRDATIVR
mmetsp:Transcript_589/g.1241  ORF Transcript_589/g.1241 Transcript_589/m.1241 type:complete len:110 (+) Transcript_589:503-832(+)